MDTVSFCDSASCKYVCTSAGSPFNNTLCLRGLNLYCQDKNMRMTCFLWPHVDLFPQPQWKTGHKWRQDGKYHLKIYVQRAGSDYSSIFHAGILLFCPELLDRVGGKLRGIKEQEAEFGWMSRCSWGLLSVMTLKNAETVEWPKISRENNYNLPVLFL